MADLAAALVFVVIVIAIVGVWWARASVQQVRQRLASSMAQATADGQLLRSDFTENRSGWHRFIRRSDLVVQLASLAEQAGSKMGAADLVLTVAAFCLAGGAIGGWRTGTAGGAIIAGVVAGALPVVYLMHRRARRIRRFQEHFADAVEMVSRAIRSGNALTSAIQLVGDEMADPIGTEFRRVTDEIRLGVDPGLALTGLQARIPTEDVAFFCTAIKIQRGSGGNLGEILDRLSEVIRKRFELLSHARVLSAQQRYAAVFVGLSPLMFSLIFYFLSPNYFDPLIESPLAPALVSAGLAMELVGGLIIWRLAKIKV